MNVNNANPALTSASSAVAQTAEDKTLFGSAAIAKIRNSVYSSTTARVGCGAVFGTITGAILTGPCGLGAMISGSAVTACFGAKLGALGGSVGGTLGCLSAPAVSPAMDRAGEAIKGTAKEAISGMGSAAVECSRVVERALIDCVSPTCQCNEEPVMMQPRSVHTQEVGDLSRIRKIVPNTDSHPVATSDIHPYIKKAEDKRSR